MKRLLKAILAALHALVMPSDFNPDGSEVDHE